MLHAAEKWRTDHEESCQRPHPRPRRAAGHARPAPVHAETPSMHACMRPSARTPGAPGRAHGRATPPAINLCNPLLPNLQRAAWKKRNKTEEGRSSQYVRAHACIGRAGGPQAAPRAPRAGAHLPAGSLGLLWRGLWAAFGSAAGTTNLIFPGPVPGGRSSLNQVLPVQRARIWIRARPWTFSALREGRRRRRVAPGARGGAWHGGRGSWAQWGSRPWRQCAARVLPMAVDGGRWLCAQHK